MVEPANIGQRLRDLYENGPITGPLPQSFVKLLDALEAQKAEIEKNRNG